MSNKQTDSQQFIEDIGGGVFSKQLGVVVSDVANSVIKTASHSNTPTFKANESQTSARLRQIYSPLFQIKAYFLLNQ